MDGSGLSLRVIAEALYRMNKRLDRFQAPVAGNHEIGATLLVGAPPAALVNEEDQEEEEEEEAENDKDAEQSDGVNAPLLLTQNMLCLSD